MSQVPSDTFLSDYGRNPRQVIETILTTNASKTKSQDLIYALENVDIETRVIKDLGLFSLALF